MEVKYLDLNKQYLSIKKEVDAAIAKVIEKSAFAAGPFVQEFEARFAEAHGCNYCVGVNSGTAALHILMLALGIKPGDEVVMPANTFFATPESVSLAGGRPVFVDCEDSYYNIDPAEIEKAVGEKTRAIIPVHLYGQPARLDEVRKLAKKYKLVMIEDCAQAHLAVFRGKSVGSYGLAGCFSFYPGKNLGAFGEGGAVVTNDKKLYSDLLVLRDHGSSERYCHERIGHNYRMDGIQGAVLNVKLKHLPAWTEKRRQNAALYCERLGGIEEIILPRQAPDVKHVYHLFVIRVPRREKLVAHLNDNGIQCGVHYPIPCHLQKAYAFLGYKQGDLPVTEKLCREVISLPMSEQLTDKEIEYVAEKIGEFYKK